MQNVMHMSWEPPLREALHPISRATPGIGFASFAPIGPALRQSQPAGGDDAVLKSIPATAPYARLVVHARRGSRRRSQSIAAAWLSPCVVALGRMNSTMT